jgi:hypothetical protein
VPTRAVQHADLGIGIQVALLTPQRRRSLLLTPFFDPSALVLKISGGVSFRDASPQTGPMLSGALAYLPSQGVDYALGVEGRAELCVFNGEVSASVDLVLVANLSL